MPPAVVPGSILGLCAGALAARPLQLCSKLCERSLLAHQAQDGYIDAHDIGAAPGMSGFNVEGGMRSRRRSCGVPQRRGVRYHRASQAHCSVMLEDTHEHVRVAQQRVLPCWSCTCLHCICRRVRPLVTLSRAPHARARAPAASAFACGAAALPAMLASHVLQQEQPACTLSHSSVVRVEFVQFGCNSIVKGLSRQAQVLRTGAQA